MRDQAVWRYRTLLDGSDVHCFVLDGEGGDSRAWAQLTIMVLRVTPALGCGARPSIDVVASKRPTLATNQKRRHRVPSRVTESTPWIQVSDRVGSASAARMVDAAPMQQIRVMD